MGPRNSSSVSACEDAERSMDAGKGAWLAKTARRRVCVAQTDQNLRQISRRKGDSEFPREITLEAQFSHSISAPFAGSRAARGVCVTWTAATACVCHSDHEALFQTQRTSRQLSLLPSKASLSTPTDAVVSHG